MRFSPHILARFMFLWPPFLGAGIRVRNFSRDGSYVRVTHHPRLFTRNGVGTAFGGTLMAMTDPFYMLASMQRLGTEYIVWDVRGEVEFRKPGKGTLTAEMRIDDATYRLIRERTAGGQKYLHWFETTINNEAGEAVATVRRQVYYRLERSRRTEGATA